MTQLLDRQFVQQRIGKDGAGISYAEFSYTLIQGYDFLYLYRQYGIDLQICGADQFGNCSSGIHLIRRLENATADVWSTPLVIDPVTGRKFGKSEGNAVWLDAKRTSIFDFYQFWLNQADSAVAYLLKIYTISSKEEIEDILARHAEHPEQRIAQKALAKGVTAIVHGMDNTEAVVNLTNFLFARDTDFATISADEIAEFASFLPRVTLGVQLIDALISTGLSSSKTEARQLLAQGAISINGAKATADVAITQNAIIKKGKNKFAIVTN